jgi:hypothetical protein
MSVRRQNRAPDLPMFRTMTLSSIRMNSTTTLSSRVSTWLSTLLPALGALGGTAHHGRHRAASRSQLGGRSPQETIGADLVGDVLKCLEQAERTKEHLLSRIEALEAAVVEALARSTRPGLDERASANSVPYVATFSESEERRFSSWLSASDRLVEQYKDSSGWEEPAGRFVHTFRDRLALLVAKGAPEAASQS